MTKEAEIPVVHVPGSPEVPAATKSRERPEPDATSSLRRSQPCPHLDFQLLNKCPLFKLPSVWSLQQPWDFHKTPNLEPVRALLVLKHWPHCYSAFS